VSLSIHSVDTTDDPYDDVVPRLWDDTIEAHRSAVRDATLDAAARLVAEHGLRGVTMSQIAEATGIGRATLYKYFPDVEAILLAWHERQITGHIGELAKLRDQVGDPGERLEAVLEAYARIHFELAQRHPGGLPSHGTELAALLHRGEHVTRAEKHVKEFVRDVVSDAVASGHLRTDIAPDELASYCLHALTAAGGLGSKAAVRRLVTVTLAGLRASA
jgi:AcrR family transcriptional regulator